MLKRVIKFEDFNEEMTEETHYFNLSKPELLKLEVGKGGVSFEQRMLRIIEAGDNNALVEEFHELILLAYGEKSADGKKFEKSDAIREAFSQTAAYDALFWELVENVEVAAEFLTAILPKEVREESAKRMKAEAKLSTSELAAAAENTDTIT